jgi:ornithine--oxo-acid transaminase
MRALISLKPALQCIAVASCLGGAEPGCERAPAALKALGLLSVIRHSGLEARWRCLIEPVSADHDALALLLLRVAAETEAVIASGERPLIIGGDHSIAAASWRGIGRALGKAPGLIWIDAHLDAHTPASSPTGNRHGMPLAALFGLGDPAMTEIPGPPLDPARVVLIGVRSYEPAESGAVAGARRAYL